MQIKRQIEKEGSSDDFEDFKKDVKTIREFILSSLASYVEANAIGGIPACRTITALSGAIAILCLTNDIPMKEVDEMIFSIRTDVENARKGPW